MAEAVSLRDSLLLARDLPNRPWHLITVLVLEGALEREALVARIGQRLDYAPRFRERVGGAPLPGWADDTGLRIAGHVRRHTLAPGQGLDAWLGEELSRPLDRLHPRWDVTLVDGFAPDRTAVVFRLHPAWVDGQAHVHLLQELLDEAPGPITGGAPEWTPQAEGLGSLLGGLSDPLRLLREAAVGLSGLAEAGLRQVTTEPTALHVAGVTVDLAQVRLVRERHRCTTHDVLLALATAGLREALVAEGGPWEDPIALVPLGVMDDTDASAIGCRVAPQWITLPVTAPSAVERLGVLASLTQTRIDTEQTVPASELADVAGFVPPTLHAVAAATVIEGRPHQALIVNAPGPRTPRYLGPRRVVSVHSIDSCVDGQRFSVGITSYGDQVTLTATSLVPLPRFARTVADELGMLSREVR